MPTAIEQQIKSRIEEFVTELDELVRQAAIESVSQALGDGAARRVRAEKVPGVRAGRPPAAVRTAGRRKGQKRSPEALAKLTDNLLAYITKNQAQGIEQIAKGMGTNTKELVLSVRKLIADKKIRAKGQKRATKYFAK